MTTGIQLVRPTIMILENLLTDAALEWRRIQLMGPDAEDPEKWIPLEWYDAYLQKHHLVQLADIDRPIFAALLRTMFRHLAREYPMYHWAFLPWRTRIDTPDEFQRTRTRIYQVQYEGMRSQYAVTEDQMSNYVCRESALGGKEDDILGMLDRKAVRDIRLHMIGRV